MTEMASVQSKPSGLAVGALWVAKVLVALAFAAAAYLKLSGNAKMVAEFGTIGLGQGFRYLTALIELGGAGLLLMPRTTRLGAGVLLGICVGAFVAQVAVLHGDLVHVFVLGGLVALIGWLSKPV